MKPGNVNRNANHENKLMAEENVNSAKTGNVAESAPSEKRIMSNSSDLVESKPLSDRKSMKLKTAEFPKLVKEMINSNKIDTIRNFLSRNFNLFKTNDFCRQSLINELRPKNALTADLLKWAEDNKSLADEQKKVLIEILVSAKLERKEKEKKDSMKSVGQNNVPSRNVKSLSSKKSLIDPKKELIIEGVNSVNKEKKVSQGESSESRELYKSIDSMESRPLIKEKVVKFKPSERIRDGFKTKNIKTINERINAIKKDNSKYALEYEKMIIEGLNQDRLFLHNLLIDAILKNNQEVAGFLLSKTKCDLALFSYYREKLMDACIDSNSESMLKLCIKYGLEIVPLDIEMAIMGNYPRKIRMLMQNSSDKSLFDKDYFSNESPINIFSMHDTDFRVPYTVKSMKAVVENGGRVSERFILELQKYYFFDEIKSLLDLVNDPKQLCPDLITLLFINAVDVYERDIDRHYFSSRDSGKIVKVKQDVNREIIKRLIQLGEMDINKPIYLESARRQMTLIEMATTNHDFKLINFLLSQGSTFTEADALRSVQVRQSIKDYFEMSSIM